MDQNMSAPSGLALVLMGLTTLLGDAKLYVLDATTWLRSVAWMCAPYLLVAMLGGAILLYTVKLLVLVGMVVIDLTSYVSRRVRLRYTRWSEVVLTDGSSFGPQLSLTLIYDQVGRPYCYELSRGSNPVGHITLSDLQRAHKASKDPDYSYPSKIGEKVPASLNEALVSDSRLVRIRNRPSCSCVFYGEDLKPVGNGFRFQDYIIVPTHVAQKAAFWKVPGAITGISENVVEGFKEVPGGYDLAFRKYEPQVFARLGLKRAPRTKPVTHGAHMTLSGYSPDDGMWATSSGPALDPVSNYEITYKVSSKSGMSGSIVMSGSHLAGIHLRRGDVVDTNVFLSLHWLSISLGVRETFVNLLNPLKRGVEAEQQLIQDESVSSDSAYFMEDLKSLSARTREAILRAEDDFSAMSPETRASRFEFLQQNTDIIEMFDDDEIEEFFQYGTVTGHGSSMVRDRLDAYNAYNESTKENDDVATEAIPEQDFRPSSALAQGTATPELGLKSGKSSSTSTTATAHAEATSPLALLASTTVSESLADAPPVHHTVLKTNSELLLLTKSVSSLQKKLTKLETSLSRQEKEKLKPTQNTSQGQGPSPLRKKRSRKPRKKSPPKGGD